MYSFGYGKARLPDAGAIATITVFMNLAFYHVRAADAIILGSRYVARWVPETMILAACIAADRAASADRQRITQPGVQVAPFLTTGSQKRIATALRWKAFFLRLE